MNNSKMNAMNCVLIELMEFGRANAGEVIIWFNKFFVYFFFHFFCNRISILRLFLDPLYVECKCSDESTHQIPGFICKNSECPPIFNPKTRPKLTRTRTRGPIQRKPAEKPDCGVFKQECKDYCLGKSGGVHIRYEFSKKLVKSKYKKIRFQKYKIK